MAVRPRVVASRASPAKGNEYGLRGCVNDDADDRRIRLDRRARPLPGQIAVFRVAPDPGKNELTISYRGHVSPEETRRCHEQMREALASLEPGYRLVVDLTGLEVMDLACANAIAAIMERCNDAGVAEIVRIIPDPTRDIGLQILRNLPRWSPG